MQPQQYWSILTGLGGLAAFWIILLIATKKHPWALVIGEDGQPSTSKFQMFIWTAAVVFAFLAIYQVRFGAGFRDDLPGIPDNLLIAMGISVVTAVSAKAIAMNSASNGASAAAAPAPPAPAPAAPAPDPALPAIGPPAPAPSASSKSGIFCDDEGRPDFGKVQLVLWTLIAVGVFLAEVFAKIHDPECPITTKGVITCGLNLPDIGPTLMILMGLGHGAYLGKKMAES